MINFSAFCYRFKHPNLFGGNSAAPTTSAGTLFGASQPAAPATTTSGLFGSSPFGAASSGAPNAATSAPAFGASAAAPTTNLFGASTPAASGPGTTFGLQKPATSGSPFGAQPAASAAPAAGGLFGAKPAGGGLFGAATSQPAPGGGLFGASQPAASPGLFGASTSQPATTGGLFGASTSQAAPAAGGGLFGQSTAGNAFGGGGGGLFGAKPALGTSTATNSFGASTNNGFGQPQQQQQQQQQVALGNSYRPGALSGSTMLGQSQRPEVSVGEKIMAVKNAWDRNSPMCRFQYFFYNLVPPEQVSQYARPPLAQNEQAWQAAVKNNPDRTRMVPVLAVGFADLGRRADAQEAMASAHVVKLQEIEKVLTALQRKHTLETTARLHRLTMAQTHLLGRLTHLIAQLHPLTPLRKSAIRPEEENLMQRLEELKREVVGGPGGGGKGKGTMVRSGVGNGNAAKVGELWALVQQRKAAVEESGRGDEPGWAVIDETELVKVLEILSQQQKGLDHLTRTLKRSQKDMDLMRREFGLPTSTPRGEDEIMGS